MKVRSASVRNMMIITMCDEVILPRFIRDVSVHYLKISRINITLPFKPNIEINCVITFSDIKVINIHYIDSDSYFCRILMLRFPG
jgi:hypothetical protein